MIRAEDREEIRRLREELGATRKELREARSDRDSARAALDAVDEIEKLKRELVDLKIEKDRIKEGHERERRTIEHKVGLEKRRQEQELDIAQREAVVRVREENLTADRERFEAQMAFTTERFEKEVGYIKDLMVKVLGRLPTVTVEKSIDLAFANGNGRSNDDD